MSEQDKRNNIDVDGLSALARLFNSLIKAATLRSGASTLNIPGAPARRELRRRGFIIEDKTDQTPPLGRQ